MKVNLFTKYSNYLLPNGKAVNKVINEIEKSDSQAQIYQKKLKGGLVAISSAKHGHNSYSDTFTIIRKDGRILRQYNRNIAFTERNQIQRKFWRLKFTGINAKCKEIIIEKYFHNKKLEEAALRKTNTYDAGVLKMVTSKAGRKTKFPKTPLGWKMIPSMMEKSVDENGDILYIENYMK